MESCSKISIYWVYWPWIISRWLWQVTQKLLYKHFRHCPIYLVVLQMGSRCLISNLHLEFYIFILQLSFCYRQVQVISQLHLFSWRSSSVTMPSLKIPNPYFMSYHILWQKQLVPHRPFLYSQNSFVQHQILIWGFYKPCIFLSIFKIFFNWSFNNLSICLQVQLSLLIPGHHLIHLISQFFIFRICRLFCNPYSVNYLDL